MSTKLKKGDLVMTDMGLAWYDRIENGEHLVNPVSWEKDHLSPHFSATKSTRADVEAYLKEKKWVKPDRSNLDYAKGLYGITVSQRGEYGVINGNLLPKDFDTAPEQLREAIKMATLLNATKD